MKIFVGSKNPVKINSCLQAAKTHWPDVKVKGLDVDSGVSDQPVGDQATKQGAINRASRALELGQNQEESSQDQMIGIGLEGGIYQDPLEQAMWSTVWAALIDQEGRVVICNGSRFKVPQKVADLINQGQEMGIAMETLLKDKNIKQRQGMIGVITDGFIDRTTEYKSLVMLVMGLWYGRNWTKKYIKK